MSPTPGFDGERHARRLAPPGVLLVAVGILLGGWLAPLLIAAGLALLVLSAASATDGVLLIGPFARAELLAASRKRVWRWRVGYALLCGVALYLSVFLPGGHLYGRRVSPSVFTQGFFLGAAGVLASYLWHLSLSVVAPAVAEEREKKRWEMLLTTDLRNREVLFGKVAGRLPGLFEPLLACLPVLAMLPLLGGVSPALVAAVSVVTLAVLFGHIALSSLASVTLPTTEKALNAARGYVWGYMGLSGALIVIFAYPPAWNFPTSVGLASPVEVRHLVEWANAGNPFGAGILHFMLGIGRSGSVEDDLLTLARRCAAFWAAVGGLTGLGAVAVLRGSVHTAAPVAAAVKTKVKAVPARPPVPDRAVAWWAEYGHLSAWAMRKVSRLGPWAYLRWLVGSLVFLGGCRWWEATHPGVWPFLGTVADFTSFLLLVVWAAVTALVPMFMGAQVIARERAADTLGGLLLTDLSPRDIVFQKWLGVLRPLRHTWMAGLAWGAAVVATGGARWWAVGLTLLIAPLLSVCWAAVGLGFSAYAANPAKAQRNLAATVFGGGYGMAILISVLLSLIPDQFLKRVAAVGVLTLLALGQPAVGLLAFRYAVGRLEREHG